MFREQREFPEFIGLSLTVRCQAKCIYCPADRGRLINPKDMPFELAAKIIDEASLNDRVKTVHLSENGEALLSPHFLDIFYYLRKKMPYVRVMLHTNMEKMDKRMAQEVLKLKLNEILPNMDGASKTTFEYAKGINFENVKKNLIDFIDLRDRMDSDCKITIQVLSPNRYLRRVVGIDTDIPDDSTQVKEYWTPLLGPQDKIVVMRGGYRWAIRDKVKRIKTGPCLFLNKNGVNPSAYIAPSGAMYVCCLDENARVVFGNVWNDSIESIWNGERRRSIMNKLNMRRYEQIGEPCIYCDQSPLPNL
ncbi:MAG: radical SAM protein [Deltaproteobacteria bacterium]|nr:radical SAM protein [Deltaproteobacteria bacterium]